MVSIFLVVLNASALCVARTDICAPASSIIEGSIGQSGGQVKITPATPMKALGAEFRAGAPVVIDVLPWSSSDKTFGAIVHVRGELNKESVISGARVAGSVRIGQVQGQPGAPQLVEATDFKSGRLQVFTAGTVDVVPGMRLQGGADIGGGTVEITSTQPVHALGLDFAAGAIRIAQHQTGPTLSGTLARAQELGGVLVESQLIATIEPRRVIFGRATLARTTPLPLLGLPTGEAPAGTIVTTDPTTTRLSGSGPVRVCGIPVLPMPTVAQPAVTFTSEQPGVAVYGGLSGSDVDVGGGLHMRGTITVRFTGTTCQRRAIEGTLARASEQERLPFAAATALAISEMGKDHVLRGTLARSAVVDGLTLTGAVMVTATPTGDLHVLDGTLAKAAPFEEWRVPAGTQVQRFDGGFSFKTPRGTSARATADHRGERVDFVTEAHSDGNSTTFTMLRPHTPKGTTLALNSVGIDHLTGCVLGDVATAQRFGIFAIPAGGNATVCGGTVVAAEGPYAVTSLQVGSWFATKAIAGVAGSPVPNNLTPSAGAAPSGALAGYWLQINSLCQGRSGIPQPPPPQRWIWVDLKGQATSEPDRRVLATIAAKTGKACPVTPCCPP